MAKSNKNFKSFRDLRNNGNDSDSDDEKNLFTGGERSGLEVEKPPEDRVRGLVRDLLQEAANSARRAPSSDDEDPVRSRFTGSGYRLGTEDAPSEVVKGEEHVPEKVTRTCTFWRNGFLIGEDKFYSYEEQENREHLENMKQGRAPLSLFDVLPGQSVDIKVIDNSKQDYNPSAHATGKSARKFVGSGHRLGSPVPGEVIAEDPVEPVESKGKEKLETANDNKKPSVADDETTVQIRMADGRVLKVTVKKDGPVQQLFDFVDSVMNTDRAYYLSMPYPVRPITDKDQSILAAKLVQSVIVQRWQV